MNENELLGGHACGFLFNFSKVTENASSTSSVMLLWGLIVTKLKYHRLLCYTTDINL